MQTISLDARASHILAKRCGRRDQMAVNIGRAARRRRILSTLNQAPSS